MSSLDHRSAQIIDTRILGVSIAASNLMARLRELKELREQVRTAQLSERKYRRIENRKRTSK